MQLCRRRSQSDFVKEQIYNEHFFGFGLANVISFSGIIEAAAFVLNGHAMMLFGREFGQEMIITR